MDAQLLLELRTSWIQARPLPVSLLRVFAMRGWVHLPQSFEIILVRAAMEDEPEETIAAFSQELAMPNLTRTGIRELNLHTKRYSSEMVVDSMELEGGLDEWETEDDDEDY